MVLTLAATALAAGNCAAPVTAADLGAHLDDAEAAWAAFDTATFTASLDALTYAVPCLADPVKPELAARYHRVLGLKLYGDGDEARALLEFTAAKASDPGYAFTEDLIPTGNPLRDQYAGLDPSSRGFRKVPEPRDGSIAFDGHFGRLRPREHATLVQLTDTTGRVVSSSWLGPDQPLPGYTAVPHIRNHVLIASAGTAAAAVATYAGALASRGATMRYEPASGLTGSEATARLEAMRGRTNGLALLSGGLLLVSAGGGVAAFAVVGDR